MKRFYRWLVQALSAASLIVAVWTGAAWLTRIWILPNWINVNFTVNLSAQRELQAHSGFNYIFFGHLRRTIPPVIGPSIQDTAACARFENQFPKSQSEIRSLAVALYVQPAFATTTGHDMMLATLTVTKIGFGYFPLVFSLLPLYLWLIPLIRWTRRRFVIQPGFCNQCGYDLRATPDKCPECGTIPAKNEVTAT